ncbi:MAG: hypothetical protein AB7E79_11885 [Rhodospirillaceae bacterium]
MTNISRRGAIGIGAAGVMGLTAGRASAQTAPTLKAVVTLAGTTYEFKEENGQDLGDFVSTIGNFTQRCIRCEVANFPLTVFFRPDRSGSRVEVVFELGRIFSAAPANLGAYSVTISRGDQTLARVDVGSHYWFSRWRWQSAPRPVVADVAKLVEQNLLPSYDRSAAPKPVAPVTLNVMPLPNGDYLDLTILAQFTAGNYANAPKLVITAAQYAALNTSATTTTTTSATSSSIYSPMGLAGITAYMPSTGERSEIGIVTEPQAKFICTADQGALDLLRAQAEAAGTMPWHMRDDTQTGPFDFRKYPNAQWYGSNRGTPYVKTASTPVTVDSAHQPALAYLPYLLTGDPYHLEDLQFQATWNWGSLPVGYRPSIPQARAFAWSTRTLAQCVKVTPATTPSWLLPQSYWANQLGLVREHFENEYVESISPERMVFRACNNLAWARGETTAPEGSWVDPWQDEFIAAVLGYIVSMGFNEWRTAFDWIIGGTMARTSVASGWIRAHSTPYRLIVRASRTSPFATSWAEAWSLQQSINKATYTDPNTWVTSDMTYLTYTRGALFYAAKLGTPGAAENLAWATSQLKAKNWNTAHKWRLGTGL